MSTHTKSKSASNREYAAAGKAKRHERRVAKRAKVIQTLRGIRAYGLVRVGEDLKWAAPGVMGAGWA